MDTRFATMVLVTNVIMLLVGFMLGDEAHHEQQDVATEATFDAHVQSALWVARRTIGDHQ